MAFCVKKLRIFLLGIIFIAVLLSLQACESSDDMEADRVGKELTEAIKEKNVKGVKSLFSPYACKNIKNIDEKVGELLSYVKGEVVSSKTEQMFCHNDLDYEYILIRVDIKTDQNEYVIFCSDLTYESDDKIGIYYMNISEEKYSVSNDEKCTSRNGIPGIMCYYYYTKETMKPCNKTKKKAKIIANAIKNKDTKTIKKLFSPYAKKKIKKMNKKLKRLCNSLEGDVQSTLIAADFSYSFAGIKENYTRHLLMIKIKTKEDTYIIKGTDCIQDKDDNRLGIMYLDMSRKIDLVLDEYDWYVYRDKPDVRFMMDEPVDDEPKVLYDYW